jgi:hypothetical protein
MNTTDQRDRDASNTRPRIAPGKPKTVRFAELVKNFGKPQNVTLWIAPASNPDFTRAVRAVGQLS